MRQRTDADSVAALKAEVALYLARMYERSAIRLLRRAATFPSDDDVPPQALLDLYTLVCRKQLARSRLAGLDTPAAWAIFQRWQRDCVYQPGG